jgi:sugar phosphate isomerase/epimerase
MKVEAVPPLHLTYCTNIHPGESWPEVLANVRTHVTAVKARVCPDRPFGVGLRLGAAAAEALAAPDELGRFRGELAARGLYVFTVNGFPYGPFHGAPVKEAVYRPDWLEEARLAYTDRLAEILAALLPDADDPALGPLEGSVSTVPGCFQARGARAAVAEACAERLRRQALSLHRLRQTSGRTISLALEPEPACLLETTADAVAFFGEHLFSRQAIAAFGRLAGLAAGAAEDALRRHLGVCLDACHAAVEMEDPAEALASLSAAGIRLGKVQVSAGLRIDPRRPGALAALAPFAEGVYLHQTVIRHAGGRLERIVDLPQALAAERRDLGDEWRVHFHVPIFRASLPPFESTQPFTEELLRLVARSGASAHLEVETYTWDVLPDAHRGEPVVDAVARELTWARERLAEAPPP